MCSQNPILVEPVELSLVNMVSRLRDIPNLGKFLDVDLLRRVASDCGVSKVDLEEGLFHRNHVMSRRLSRVSSFTSHIPLGVADAMNLIGGGI